MPTAEVKEDGTVERGFHRHEQDPKNWVEEGAVTGRPNDVAPDNSTFASRKKKDAKEAKPTDVKVVRSEDAEDKAVTSSRARTKS